MRTPRSYLRRESQAQTPRTARFVGKSSRPTHQASAHRDLDVILGKRVKSAKDLRMGDLSSSRARRPTGSSPRGIYDNNGIFIHLPDNAVGVRMRPFTATIQKRYLAARRNQVALAQASASACPA